MTRARDESFETLAVVCLLDWQNLTPNQRGQLNEALQQIRMAEPELEDHELASVIDHTAKAYRSVYEGMPVTPTALASHWRSVAAEYERRKQPTTYVVNDGSYCTTCNGHKMVFAHTRPSPNGEPLEAWAPCPDCNQTALAEAREYHQRMDRIHGAAPPPAPPQEVLDYLAERKGS